MLLAVYLVALAIASIIATEPNWVEIPGTTWLDGSILQYDANQVRGFNVENSPSDQSEHYFLHLVKGLGRREDYTVKPETVVSKTIQGSLCSAVTILMQ